MKPLIVMALESEGQGKLEALGYDVVYCGVGKVNSAYNLMKKLFQAKVDGHKYDYVLNMGSAGSNTFNKGMLVAADKFVQRDMDASGIGFPVGHTPFEEGAHIIEFQKIFEELPHGICGSGDSFLQGESPVPCNIIDMEAYALAKICKLENIPFACIKYITDGADEGASNDWQANLKHAAEAFVGLLSGKN
jgi:adenosylhomocysteine nucleosidase